MRFINVIKSRTGRPHLAKAAVLLQAAFELATGGLKKEEKQPRAFDVESLRERRARYLKAKKRPTVVADARFILLMRFNPWWRGRRAGRRTGRPPA
jgi:hypothetical protein